MRPVNATRFNTILLIIFFVIGAAASVALPQRTSAAAISLSTATSVSDNASTTLAKIGDTITFSLELSGTPDATSSPVIRLLNVGFTMASTSMSGSGTSWTYSTTSTSVWSEGNVTFNTGWGGTLGEATTTFASAASTTFTHVEFDKTAPVITIVGDNPDTATFSGSHPYDDEGATASDTRDGTVSTTIFGNVDRSIAGTHTITYTAVDAAGNTSTADRTVTVTAQSSSGGGGGGGGGSYSAPTPITFTPVTSAAPEVTLEALRAQLNALFAQIAALTGSPSPVSSLGATLARTLAFGLAGDDVRALQVYLNTHGFPVASTGPGSLGNETTVFGNATRAAVIKLQEAAGITPAVGVVGPQTRAYINANP